MRSRQSTVTHLHHCHHWVQLYVNGPSQPINKPSVTTLMTLRKTESPGFKVRVRSWFIIVWVLWQLLHLIAVWKLGFTESCQKFNTALIVYIDHIVYHKNTLSPIAPNVLFLKPLWCFQSENPVNLRVSGIELQGNTDKCVRLSWSLLCYGSLLRPLRRNPSPLREHKQRCVIVPVPAECQSDWSGKPSHWGSSVWLKCPTLLGLRIFPS